MIMKVIDIESIPRQGQKGGAGRVQGRGGYGCMAGRSRRDCLYMAAVFVVFGLVLSIGFSAWYGYKHRSNVRAQEAMFEAVYDFEEGKFQEALDGNALYMGFLDLLKQYPHTQTAHLLRFYIGASYMHLADYEQAALYLKDCHLRSPLMQARVFCLLGDAYGFLEKFQDASKAYLKAADYDSSLYTPGYLMKAAVVLQEMKAYKEAYSCYDRLIEKYPSSDLKSMAVVQRAKLERLL